MPVTVAMLLLTAVTWWALARVEARPALPPEHETLDRAVRHVSAVRILRLAAAGSLFTAAGLWVTLGATVRNVMQNLRLNDPSLTRDTGDWATYVGGPGLAIGAVLGLLGVVALCWRTGRVWHEPTDSGAVVRAEQPAGT